jgi:hypothetical protein
VSLKFDESMAVHILAGDLQFDLAATVKWLREADENSWFLGCHIKPELSEDALDRLAAMGLLDRRVSLRKEVELSASISGELETTKTPAIIRNLSEDGFGLSTQVSRVVGQRVRVTAVNGHCETLDFTARVIWQIKTHGGFFCGCAFLTRESHTELNALLSSEQSGRRRRVRSTRRTSMWVALAALVVFVFPSLIVLLLNEQAATRTPIASGESTPTNDGKAKAAAPSNAQNSARTSPSDKTDKPAKNETPESPEPPIHIETSPELSTTEPQPTGDATNDANTMVQTGEWSLEAMLTPIATEPVATEPLPGDFAIAPNPVEPSPVSETAEPPAQNDAIIEFHFADEIARAFDLARAISQAIDLSSANTTAPEPIEHLPPQDPPPQDPLSPADEFRTWTDSTGEYRVVAKLISVEGADGDNESTTNGAMVRLLKQNGRHTSVPLAKLSPADAQFVRNWLAERP